MSNNEALLRVRIFFVEQWTRSLDQKFVHINMLVSVSPWKVFCKHCTHEYYEYTTQIRRYRYYDEPLIRRE